MHRRNFIQTLFSASVSAANNSNTSVDRAFARLYEFDFKGVQDFTAANLNDPLAHGVRAAAILFHEFQQLNIWEGEDFFETGKRSKAKPNVEAKTAFYGDMKEARRRVGDESAAGLRSRRGARRRHRGVRAGHRVPRRPRW